jgi:hypothetical protein
MFSAETAARVFAALGLLVAAFQLALALGAPWGALTWGGRFPGQLPGPMRVAAAVSLILVLMFTVIVLARAGLVRSRRTRLLTRLTWLVVAYCAVGVVANAITPSVREQRIWLPVVTTMLVCSVRVARS